MSRKELQLNNIDEDVKKLELELGVGNKKKEQPKKAKNDWRAKFHKPIPLHKRIYYWFWRLGDAIIDTPRMSKRFLQRQVRGYAEPDLWSLYYHLGGIIHKTLVAFKYSDRNGYPADLEETEWEEILDDMIYAFNYFKDVDEVQFFLMEWYPDNYKEKLDEIEERTDKGGKLFIKHFNSLCD